MDKFRKGQFLDSAFSSGSDSTSPSTPFYSSHAKRWLLSRASVKQDDRNQHVLTVSSYLRDYDCLKQVFSDYKPIVSVSADNHLR